MSNNLTVEFIPKDNETFMSIPAPTPSKKYIPEWFQKMPPSLADVDNRKMDSTAKKCMPFFDIACLWIELGFFYV